jgi:hypothetical protein
LEVFEIAWNTWILINDKSKSQGNLPLSEAVALAKTKRKRTVLKSFRIPRETEEALYADAKEAGGTETDILNSLLTKYIEFDRFAKKFGFVTVSRGTFKAIMDALPEEKIRELAVSQSSRIEELAVFWFKKRDIETFIRIMDIFSKHMRLSEYTLSRTRSDLILTLRTDLGNKAALFASVYLQRGIEKLLGLTPEVELVENEVTLKVPLKAGRA